MKNIRKFWQYSVSILYIKQTLKKWRCLSFDKYFVMLFGKGDLG
jgi:hypothetical protein